MTTRPPPHASNSAFDRSLEPAIASLLERMTLVEKVGQMSQVHVSTDHVPAGLRADIAAGRVGSVLNSVDADLNRELQRIAVEESRLGIPLLVGRDVIHGFSTVFPIPLGQAATWNPDRVRQGARVAATEAAAAGVNLTFAPMVDISRDPRWGRIAESLGEDPFLASVLAVAMVEGFQGTDLRAPGAVAACVKHFAGYGASESGRDYNSTNIPENELRNVHLPPFRAAVDAGVAGLMASFSDLDGIPATANEWLMRGVLRDEWGFQGLTVSDWESIPQLAVHGLTANDRESALAAALAGIDMEMTSTTYRDHLAALVADGAVDPAQLDAMVANILRVKFRLGLFEQTPTGAPSSGDTPNPDHLRAAREAAAESLVLLKNDNDLLPLRPESTRSVAVIGPLADAPHDQLGTWIFDGDPGLAVTPLQALRSDGLKIHHVRALETSRSLDTRAFSDAVAAAEGADAVLLFLGEESILSGEAHCRADIRLPGAQEQLIEAVANVGKPIVLVILAGRPLALGNVADRLAAIIYAWHPGAMGGPAIVDALFGRTSPSGKLPVTFPRVVGQVPIYYSHKNTGKPPTTDSITLIDDIPVEATQTSLGNTSFHLDAGSTPLFAFGHGLSYGRFVYSNIRVSEERVGMGSAFEIAADLANQGQREAVEVAQLYVRDPVANVTRPVRELKGFQRVRLAPGESTTVRFRLSTDDLAFYDRHMKRIVEPGRFHAWIGGSSEASLRIDFEVVAD